MKRLPLLFVLLVCTASALPAQSQWSFKGTVIRMRMADCVIPTGIKSSLGAIPVAGASCPEYTVMSPKVVYVVVGHRTEAFIPLAEDMDFHIRKNEIVIVSNDDHSKSRFFIQAMTLRSDWEQEAARKVLMDKALERSVSYELRNPPRASR